MDILSDAYVNGLGAFLEGIDKATELGLFDKDKDKNGSMSRRVKRTILSQGNADFAEFFTGNDPSWVRDPHMAHAQATAMMNKVTKAQQGMNYAPGIQGHHPISVNSIEAASAHLPLRQRLEFVKILNDEYQAGGTNAWGMVGLTQYGHQGRGRNTNFGQFNAHATADPKRLTGKRGYDVDTSTWASEDFSSISNPRKLAAEFWRRSGEPQMRFAEMAYDSKPETRFRQMLADKLGVPVRDLDLYSQGKPKGRSKTGQFFANAVKAKIKDLGIDVNALMNEAYGIKPKPASTREGTRAFLNGKPVVRQGGQWVNQLSIPRSTFKPKPTRAPAVSKPNTKPNFRNRLMSSQQIRNMTRQLPDAIHVIPGQFIQMPGI